MYQLLSSQGSCGAPLFFQELYTWSVQPTLTCLQKQPTRQLLKYSIHFYNAECCCNMEAAYITYREQWIYKLIWYLCTCKTDILTLWMKFSLVKQREGEAQWNHFHSRQPTSVRVWFPAFSVVFLGKEQAHRNGLYKTVLFQ